MHTVNVMAPVRLDRMYRLNNCSRGVVNGATMLLRVMLVHVGSAGMSTIQDGWRLFPLAGKKLGRCTWRKLQF